MSDLSAFPITKCWPAKESDRLQLYSAPTPNGVTEDSAPPAIMISASPYSISRAASPKL